MIPNQPAAYIWSDPQGAKDMITVTVLCSDARKQLVERAASEVKAHCSKIDNTYAMRPTQFRRFQTAYASICTHPSTRLYAWVVHPWKPNSKGNLMALACCDCGTALPLLKLPKIKREY